MSRGDIGRPLRRFAPPPASSMAPYPSFSPKGEKLGHCASPPFPSEPAMLGFAGGPVWGRQCAHRHKFPLQGGKRWDLECAETSPAKSEILPPPLTGEAWVRILVSPDRGDAPQGQRGSCRAVAIFHRGAPQEDFLRRCCAPPPGAVGTKRRKTSGRERSFAHEFPRG